NTYAITHLGPPSLAEIDLGELIEQSRLPAQIGLHPPSVASKSIPILRRGLLRELPVRGLVKRRRFGSRGCRQQASIRKVDVHTLKVTCSSLDGKVRR